MPRQTSGHKARDAGTSALLRVPVARYHRAATAPGRITSRHYRSR